MDGDGEDQPQEIIKMLRLSRKYKNYVITSNRKKGKESFLIRSLYNLHLILTFLFTFKWMSFGNFTTFHSCNLDKILSSNSSWLAHSSSVMKTCNIKRLYAKRGKRYFGKSKLNLIDLVEHSLRVNAVFSGIILLSLLYLFMIMTLLTSVGLNLKILISLFIVAFNLLVIFIKSKHYIKNLNNLNRLYK